MPKTNNPRIDIEEGTPTFHTEDLGPQGGKLDLPKDPKVVEQFKPMLENMGIEPDGTIPPLDSELADCLFISPMGEMEMIGHPLVHELYFPADNGRYNEALKKKRELIAKLETEGKWLTIFFIGLVERPYQLTWLNKWADDMPDEVYWEAVGHVWTDSENIWQHEEGWRKVLTSDRSGREHIMDDDEETNEHEYFASLPEEIKIYRGTSAPNEMGSGLSWTLDIDVARQFAKRYRFRDETPRLITGRVKKEDVYAFFDRRAEKEIVTLPEKVEILTTQVVKKP